MPISISNLPGLTATTAGGFTTGALVYIFQREHFHAIIRPALLTAMLGTVNQNPGYRCGVHVGAMRGDFVICQGTPLGDLDGNGTSDVIVASAQDDQVWHIDNEGGSQFARPALLGVLGDTSRLTLGDLDDDGDLDIVGVSRVTNDVVRFGNNGDRTFTALDRVDANLSNVIDVLVADLVRGSPEWEAAFAKSKFDGTEGFGLARTGHITLQDHADLVWDGRAMEEILTLRGEELTQTLRLDGDQRRWDLKQSAIRNRAGEKVLDVAAWNYRTVAGIRLPIPSISLT